MSTRRVIKAIRSIDIYIDTAFFDEQDKGRIVNALKTAIDQINGVLEEMS